MCELTEAYDLHAGNKEKEESCSPIYNKYVAHRKYDINMKDNEEFGDYHGNIFARFDDRI